MESWCGDIKVTFVIEFLIKSWIFYKRHNFPHANKIAEKASKHGSYTNVYVYSFESCGSKDDFFGDYCDAIMNHQNIQAYKNNFAKANPQVEFKFRCSVTVEEACG